jgi:hypothetical protein
VPIKKIYVRPSLKKGPALADVTSQSLAVSKAIG